MDNVNDASDSDAVVERRERLGEWITDQIHHHDTDCETVAAKIGVPADVVAAWEAGLAAMTLDQAAALDRVFMLPAGTTGAAGGYLSFLATPYLDGEEVFTTREFAKVDHMLEELEAAVKLGLGVRLANRWEPVEVDHDHQSFVAEQRWTLDLLTNAPSIDPLA